MSIHRPSVTMDHLMSFMVQANLYNKPEASELVSMIREIADREGCDGPELRFLVAAIAYVREVNEDR